MVFVVRFKQPPYMHLHYLISHWPLKQDESNHPLSSLTLASWIRASKRTLLEEICVRLTYSYGPEQNGIGWEKREIGLQFLQLVGYIIDNILHHEKTVVTGLRAITIWPVEFASGQLTKLVG